jgi:hypothetical protein
MPIREDGPEVTEHELQYARRVLKVLAALIERGDPDVMAALSKIGWAVNPALFVRPGGER